METIDDLVIAHSFSEAVFWVYICLYGSTQTLVSWTTNASLGCKYSSLTISLTDHYDPVSLTQSTNRWLHCLPVEYSHRFTESHEVDCTVMAYQRGV